MNYKNTPAFIFDFDGTLANTFDIVVRAMNQFSEHYGYEPVSEDRIDYLRGLPAHQVLKSLGIPWYKVPDMILRFQRYVKDHMVEVELFPSVVDALMMLKSRGHILGIITSNSRENVTLLLKKHECETLDFIHSSRHLLGKATTLKKVIKQWGLDKNLVYYIGDETRDIDAARSCGIKSVAVTWGFNKRTVLEAHKPDYLVDSLDDLLSI